MKPEIVYANILGRTMRCEVVKVDSPAKSLIYTPPQKLSESVYVPNRDEQLKAADAAAEKKLLARALSVGLQLSGLYKRMGDTRKEGIAAKAFVEILKLSGKSPAEDKNKLWH